MAAAGLFITAVVGAGQIWATIRSAPANERPPGSAQKAAPTPSRPVAPSSPPSDPPAIEPAPRPDWGAWARIPRGPRPRRRVAHPQPNRRDGPGRNPGSRDRGKDSSGPAHLADLTSCGDRPPGGFEVARLVLPRLPHRGAGGT